MSRTHKISTWSPFRRHIYKHCSYIHVYIFGYWHSVLVATDVDRKQIAPFHVPTKQEITRWWSNRQDRTKAQIIRYILSNMNRSLSSRIYRWLLSEIYEVFHPSSKCTLLINWKRKYARFISFGHKYDIIEDMEETKPWIWVWLPQMKYVPL